MHQIQFRLGLRPRPRWGSLQCSPDPLAGFKGPTSKGGEEVKRAGEERGGERRKEGEQAFLVTWRSKLSALNPFLGMEGEEDMEGG